MRWSANSVLRALCGTPDDGEICDPHVIALLGLEFCEELGNFLADGERVALAASKLRDAGYPNVTAHVLREACELYEGIKKKTPTDRLEVRLRRPARPVTTPLTCSVATSAQLISRLLSSEEAVQESITNELEEYYDGPTLGVVADPSDLPAELVYFLLQLTPPISAARFVRLVAFVTPRESELSSGDEAESDDDQGGERDCDEKMQEQEEVVAASKPLGAAVPDGVAGRVGGKRRLDEAATGADAPEDEADQHCKDAAINAAPPRPLGALNVPVVPHDLSLLEHAMVSDKAGNILPVGTKAAAEANQAAAEARAGEDIYFWTGYEARGYSGHGAPSGVGPSSSSSSAGKEKKATE